MDTAAAPLASHPLALTCPPVLLGKPSTVCLVVSTVECVSVGERETFTHTHTHTHTHRGGTQKGGKTKRSVARQDDIQSSSERWTHGSMHLFTHTHTHTHTAHTHD